MTGATHFVEVYKSRAGTVRSTLTPLPIGLLQDTIQFNKSIGFQTLFVWFIKPKPAQS